MGKRGIERGREGKGEESMRGKEKQQTGQCKRNKTSERGREGRKGKGR